MDEDTEQAAYHQLSEEARRFQEERVEAERDAWERIKFNEKRPWFDVIDHDEKWIARVSNAD